MLIQVKSPIDKSLNIPLLFSSIQAGFPSPSDGYIERSINLHKEVVKHPASTFFFEVIGNSMAGIGMFEGDTLVVDRSLTPHNGDPVIATINNENFLKLFYRTNKGIVLTTTNPKLPKVVIGKDDQFEVWGVVRNSLRHFRRT